MTPIAVGNGLDTTFNTPHAYIPESLEVDVEGVHQAAVESDPTTGEFTLPYAPRTGAVISVAYRIASTTTLNQPIADPGRELGPVPGNDIAAVGSANAAGTDSYEYANDSHVHEGVHQITADGGNLFGNVTLAAGTNMTISRSGQTVTFASSGGGGGGGGWETQSTDGVKLESGRERIWDAALDASFYLNYDVFYVLPTDARFEIQGGWVDMTNGGQDGTNGGLIVPKRTSDPSSPTDGTIWYRTDTNKLRLRANGSTVDLN